MQLSGFKISLVCATCFVSSWTKAQLYLDNTLKSGALIARNLKTNFGEARLKGTVSNTKYTKLQYRIWQNGKVYSTNFHSLSFSSGIANFDLKPKLKAGKYKYDILLELISSDTIRRWIKDVVVGDVFIVQGQSNAVANAFSGYANPTYKDSFIRSFGSSTYGDIGAFVADSFWHIANGDGAYSSGCVGQWALVMAKAMLDSFGIPIAIFNGAIGGTSVAFHQRYEPEPANIYTCYGRLLTRLKAVGLDKNIRSIFWFQGETDGTQPKLHDSLFRILYSKWALDYKETQQNYLVQVRGGGCGYPTAEMLEIQRQFEFDLPKLKVVSSNGLNGHDGCHYWFKNGYEQLGFQFAALMARDLYGSSRKTNIDPPQIKTAYFSKGDFAELVLEMERPDDSVYVDAGFHQLFFINGDSAVTIIGGKRWKNRIYLQLNKGTCKTIYLSYMGKSWGQPWVKNQFGMGLIGFHLVPVQRITMRTIFSACPGKPATIGEDSVAGFQYKWFLPNGKVKNTAKIVENLKQDAQYKLVVSYPGIGCKPDTFLIFAVLDKTEKPDLGRDTALCHGTLLSWNMDGLYAQVQWQQNQNTWNQNAFETDSNGEVILHVKSSLGCTLSDTIFVQTSSPTVQILAPPGLCPGADTLVYATPGFKGYFWNGFQNDSNVIRSGSGTLRVLATDTLGCKAMDSVVISTYILPQKPTWKWRICPYDSIAISKPNGFQSWFLHGTENAETVYLKPNSYAIVLQDSQGCVQYTTADIETKEIPIFSLGNDTSICPGSTTEWRCSFFTLNYLWNGEKKPTNVFRTSASGLVSCTVTNNQGCSFSDTAYVFYKPVPHVHFPKDTVLCIGSIWKPDMLLHHKYRVNGNTVSDLQFHTNGLYRIEIENPEGCTASQEMLLQFQPCVSGVLNQPVPPIHLYPNPSADYIYVAKENCGRTLSFSDCSGRKVMELLVPEDGKLYISGLPDGVYVLQIGISSGYLLKKH